MSVKDVKAFFEKVEGDKGLQAKLRALEGKKVEVARAELIQIAADAGFKFTAADFAAARKARARSTKLSEAELKAVAAGTGGFKGLGVYILPGGK